MKTMDAWRTDLKSQDFVNKFKDLGMQKCVASISDWIASHREKILLAWWAEYGFKVGSATLVEERNGTEYKTYIRECTAEEKERANTIHQHTQAKIGEELIKMADMIDETVDGFITVDYQKLKERLRQLSAMC